LGVALKLTLGPKQASDELAADRIVPRSWCGNSAHQVFLAPGERWRLVAPRYEEGGLPALLRFRLARRDQEPLLSEPFPGAVDPAQFGEKQGHSPQSLMDPYDE